jgi:hypothetical protein
LVLENLIGQLVASFTKNQSNSDSSKTDAAAPTEKTK